MSFNKNTLANEITAIIAHEGPLSLERYMDLCLGHPTYGYYTTREPFGATGDFTTAPEISQMFGELLGLWAAETWRICGAFSPPRLIELGPGRGVLMADALRAARAAPAFCKDLEAVLVEMSPRLVERQKKTLCDATQPIKWVSRIQDLPDGPAIILANEFFDALPIRQYVKSPEGWRERHIGLNEAGSFIFGLSAATESYLQKDAPSGAIYEVATVGLQLAAWLGARIAQWGGAFLFIDYGYTQPSYGDTLQAVRRHAHADPLTEPGTADLTTHVDFTAFSRAFSATGLKVFGPVPQSDFLKNLGIDYRAHILKMKASTKQAQDIDAAHTRLTATTHPTDMGALFKVMAVARKDVHSLPGFTPQVPL